MSKRTCVVNLKEKIFLEKTTVYRSASGRRSDVTTQMTQNPEEGDLAICFKEEYMAAGHVQHDSDHRRLEFVHQRGYTLPIFTIPSSRSFFALDSFEIDYMN